MRIALVSRYLPPRGGGIGVYTEKTARALAIAGHETHVFTTTQSPTRREAFGPGVHTHHLPNTWSRLREVRVLVGALRLDRAIRRAGPFDIVQACEWEAEAALYARRSSAPLVTRLATPHYLNAELNGLPAWENRRQLLVRWLERYQARHSACVISPSSALAVRVTNDWGLDPDRVTVVPTGIDQALWDGSRSVVAAQLPQPTVLYFGRLEDRKGVKEWIDALPTVFDRCPEVTALFVGQDLGLRGRPFRDYARRVCGSHWSRVQFLPHIEQRDLFPIIAGASLVVLPSRWENLSNACLEAMALARPVLATRGSAFEEVIEDGVSGFLVAPYDSTALAEVAARVLGEPTLLAEIGRAAQRRAQDFDLRTAVLKLVDVYAGVRSLAEAA